MHFSIDRTVHTTAFDKPVVDHWLERKIYFIRIWPTLLEVLLVPNHSVMVTSERFLEFTVVLEVLPMEASFQTIKQVEVTQGQVRE